MMAAGHRAQARGVPLVAGVPEPVGAGGADHHRSVDDERPRPAVEDHERRLVVVGVGRTVAAPAVVRRVPGGVRTHVAPDAAAVGAIAAQLLVPDLERRAAGVVRRAPDLVRPERAAVPLPRRLDIDGEVREVRHRDDVLVLEAVGCDPVVALEVLGAEDPLAGDHAAVVQPVDELVPLDLLEVGGAAAPDARAVEPDVAVRTQVAVEVELAAAPAAHPAEVVHEVGVVEHPRGDQLEPDHGRQRLLLALQHCRRADVHVDVLELARFVDRRRVGQDVDRVAAAAVLDVDVLAAGVVGRPGGPVGAPRSAVRQVEIDVVVEDVVEVRIADQRAGDVAGHPLETRLRDVEQLVVVLVLVGRLEREHRRSEHRQAHQGQRGHDEHDDEQGRAALVTLLSDVHRRPHGIATPSSKLLQESTRIWSSPSSGFSVGPARSVIIPDSPSNALVWE